MQFSSQILLFCWIKVNEYEYNGTLDAERVVCVFQLMYCDEAQLFTSLWTRSEKGGNIWNFIHDKNINTGPVEQSIIEMYSNSLNESLTSAQCCTSQTLHLRHTQTKNI